MWVYELFDDEVVRDDVWSWVSRKPPHLVETCRPALAYFDRRQKAQSIYSTLRRIMAITFI